MAGSSHWSEAGRWHSGRRRTGAARTGRRPEAVWAAVLAAARVEAEQGGGGSGRDAPGGGRRLGWEGRRGFGDFAEIWWGLEIQIQFQIELQRRKFFSVVSTYPP